MLIYISIYPAKSAVIFILHYLWSVRHCSTEPRSTHFHSMSSATNVPDQHTHNKVLQHSQLASVFLERQSGALQLSPWSYVFPAESPELWNDYEQLVISCLQSGDDKAAHACIERLSRRFGPSNDRILGLKGMCQEAVAPDGPALEHVLRDYEDLLSQNPTNAVCFLPKGEGH